MARRLLYELDMSSMFKAIDQLGNAMNFHRERHSVLSGNVANVDTPGYKPFDLERLSFEDIGDEFLIRTHESHMATSDGGFELVQEFDSSGGTTTADGNAVNLERELAKLDANRVRYNTSSELVTRRFAMLRYAATDGVG